MVFPAREHISKTLKALHDVLPETEKAKTHVLILCGEHTPFRNDTDREMPFRQESNFYYLTGCQVPESILMITYAFGTSFEKSPSINLFIPPVSQDDITWSVPPPTIAEAADIFQATKILPTTDMLITLQDTFKAFPGSVLHTLPMTKLYPEFPKDFLSHDLSTKAETSYLIQTLHKARLTKSAWEIAQIRKANDISSRAHETVMRVLAQGVKDKYARRKNLGPEVAQVPGEWCIEREQDAEAIFVASCHREGGIRQAYLPIVASSVRASTLHYCCNDKAFAWGPIEPRNIDFYHPHLHVGGLERAIPIREEGSEPDPQVLLIDAGCEWENYASDITRVTPVGNGGKFSKETREIYSLVLEMQEESIKMAKSGVHWDAVHLLCHDILIRGFLSLGIFKHPSASAQEREKAILNSGISTAFFPHGVGHSLGLDVHDVPSVSKPESGEGKSDVPDTLDEAAATGVYRYLRLRIALEEGMVVTVEPGIYFSPHLLAPIRNSPFIDVDVLKRYESVGGIRIEDAVAITSDGCDVLTKVGKSLEWIEAVCSGEA